MKKILFWLIVAMLPLAIPVGLLWCLVFMIPLSPLTLYLLFRWRKIRQANLEWAQSTEWQCLPPWDSRTVAESLRQQEVELPELVAA